jgi:beta-glucosidase
MIQLAISPLVTCLALASMIPAQNSEAQKVAKNPAVTPQPRIVEWWFARHAKKIGEMSKGDIELLVVGDSITNNFETVGAKVWKKHFEPRKAINLGFGGDRTNHVLWRLDHLPKLKKAPKAAVVLIGTNNICWGSDTPRQAAVGVQAVARKLNGLYPEMKILVLAVFPRRRQASHPHRKEVVELNSLLPALLKDIENVKLLDIGAKFIDAKGNLPKEMMPDTTHPSEKGHEVWAEAIAPELDKMLANRSVRPPSKAKAAARTGDDDLLGSKVDVSGSMESDAVLLEMKAGSSSIHDSYIIHGSEANHSDRRRAAYTMHYANAKTVTVDTENHWVPVYLVRGNGDGDYQ